MIRGTHADARFSRGVDGDTIRVFLPGATEDESLRILALDTEESYAGGSKPVTPLGKKAKTRAERFFDGAQDITIEFPGLEDFDTCVAKYKGNYGRLLVYVYRDGVDFQETMIREGYSPYFTKYGHAEFADHHRRYALAERDAQRRHIGVWDQIGENGSEMRNYAALGTWWRLRARVIDEYRALRAMDATLLDSRLDYATIETKAEAGEKATIFTELKSVKRAGGSGGVIGMGSRERPFNLFLPDIDSADGQEIVNLLEARYASAGEDHPRRSYAYVTGTLSTYQARPQMVLTTAEQISDSIVARADGENPSAAVVIAALLPDPAGPDRGAERVTLRNSGPEPVDLTGWTLRDRAENSAALDGSIDAGQDREITLPPGRMPLNNTGDNVALVDGENKIRNAVSYSASDVEPGQPIRFG